MSIIINPYRYASGGASDPLFAFVTSLLHFNGTNGSTTFTDVKGLTWTPTGGATISTALSKFGGASGNTSAGGRIANTSSAFNVPASTPFCMEAWLYCVTGGGSPMPNDQVTSNKFIGLFCDTATSGRVIINGSNVLTGITFPSSVFFHYALERVAGNTMTAYVNGVSAASASFSGSIMGTEAVTLMGSATHTGWTSNVDEFRMTNGSSRYNGAFTPPSSAFPDS